MEENQERQGIRVSANRVLREEMKSTESAIRKVALKSTREVYSITINWLGSREFNNLISPLTALIDTKIISRLKLQYNSFSLTVEEDKKIQDTIQTLLKENLLEELFIQSIYLNPDNEVDWEDDKRREREYYDKFLKKIANALQNNTRLKKLELPGMLMAADGLNELCDVLQCDTTLTMLELSSVNLNVEDLKKIENLLEINRTLDEISINNAPSGEDYLPRDIMEKWQQIENTLKTRKELKHKNAEYEDLIKESKEILNKEQKVKNKRKEISNRFVILEEKAKQVNQLAKKEENTNIVIQEPKKEDNKEKEEEIIPIIEEPKEQEKQEKEKGPPRKKQKTDVTYLANSMRTALQTQTKEDSHDMEVQENTGELEEKGYSEEELENGGKDENLTQLPSNLT